MKTFQQYLVRYQITDRGITWPDVIEKKVETPARGSIHASVTAQLTKDSYAMDLSENFSVRIIGEPEFLGTVTYAI